MAQRAVDRERLRGHLRLEALRQDDLIDVARGDVLLGRPHLLLEALARVVGPHVERVPRLAAHVRQAPLELALEKLNLRARELIQRFEIVVGRDPGVRDDQNPVLDVVERQHRIEQHEPGIVGAVGAGAEIAQHRLEPRRRAVAEIADRAAREPRQLRHEGRPEIGHQVPQRVDERPIAFRRAAAALDRRAPLARPENQEGIFAEKRIPADVLAPFDALQQERVVRVLGDLQERGDRREQIGHDLLAHGHERAAPRQLLEFLKRRNFHRVQTPPAASTRPLA